MSIILGLYDRHRTSIDRARMLQLSAPTARYADNGTAISIGRGVGIAFQLFATRSSEEAADHLAASEHGDRVAVDGRLDNHIVLAGMLGLRKVPLSHAEVVLAAFQRWGEACFAQFAGEWSISLWSAETRCLYLARDHAGTRNLYYAATEELVLWSTFLETFFVETPSRRLCREFVVRYLRGVSIGQATPYEDVFEVPPAHFLKFSASGKILVEHWSSLTDERIRYRDDLDYGRHLFHLVSEAVERRAAPCDDVVAQLSGGMDSSTIVAVSDHLRTRSGASNDDLLSTVSLIDPTEPCWNELPYIEAFEKYRGKVGTHIQASYLDRNFGVPQAPYLYPGADASTLAFERAFEESLGCGRFRAILSGIGGDELLGGLPNPLPELADYLATYQWRTVLRPSFAWSYSEKISLWHLFFAVCRFVRIPHAAQNVVINVPWLTLEPPDPPDSVQRVLDSARRLPSSIDRAIAWNSILETMPHMFPAATVRYEYRYPLLDRDLVEFLLRLPPEQIRRPGQRRFLMKRSLGPVLPPEVLGRTRKASLKRGPILLLEQRREAIETLFRDSLLAEAGYVDAKRLLASVPSIRKGESQILRPALMRTLQLEIWLRSKPPLN